MSTYFHMLLYVVSKYVFRRIIQMDKEFIKKRITNFRIANNISARKLSLDLGYSSEHINQIETGRLNPTLDFIMVFCEHLKIPMSEFFNENFEYSPQIVLLNESIKKLDADELKDICSIVTKLGNKDLR